MSAITNAVNQANNEFNQALAKQKGSTMDKDSFMLLLVTQFKYQDPLNPMEDKEFISQMAQFSSLEQMMNMNESMEKQTEAINNQQMVNATSYIGKLVSVTGNTIGKTSAKDSETGEMTTSISTFRYAFGDNVVKGTLSIRDGSGNTVYTEDLAGKQAGTTFEFNWNGLNGAGQEAPDGVYTVSLSAFNDKGEAVLADQVVDATVTGVVNQDGEVYLGMDGGQLLSLANVRQVTTPKVKEIKPANPADEDNKDEEGDDSAEDVSGGDAVETPDNTGSADNSGMADGEENSGTENADNTPTMPDTENPAQVENDYTA